MTGVVANTAQGTTRITAMQQVLTFLSWLKASFLSFSVVVWNITKLGASSFLGLRMALSVSALMLIGSAVDARHNTTQQGKRHAIAGQTICGVQIIYNTTQQCNKRSSCMSIKPDKI
jgi:hypothetical protein